MERMKLKKWVKVLLTAIIIIIDLLVYSTVGYSNFKIEVIKWLWLGFGQLILLTLIWD